MTPMADGYPLDRGEFESKRLDIQNEVWTRNIGYYIHPSIASRLSPTSRIADIGTGTGIYLTELSRTLPPTTHLDGYDVSAAQFPAPSSLPPNVHLSVHNAKHPFPASLHGTYDFIHLRLLVSALEKHEWAPMARICLQLLKPGGSVQWAEGDLLQANYDYLKDGEAVPAESLRRINTLFQTSLGHKLAWGHSTLPGVFRELGLERVFQDVVSSDRVVGLRADQTRASHGAMFGWAKQRAVEGAERSWGVEELEGLKGECEREIKGGTYGRFDIYVTVGTKGTKEVEGAEGAEGQEGGDM